jgi:disulfide bond formation protein DsbB
MTRRRAGAITLLATLAALGTAYYAQYVLLLMPCELCLWERWPYRLVALLGLAAVLLPRRGAGMALVLAVLVLLGGCGIAFLHVGVEAGWWNSPLPECNGILTPGAPLPAIPARPCDAPVYLIPFLPVSMSAMDLVYEAAFALTLLAYVIRNREVSS